MSLNAAKLKQVVKLADGNLRARCPACAESGHDKRGEHLRVYPDGRFGCCVHPGDREHRKRIFALAGERVRRTIAVKVATAQGDGPVQRGILRRLQPTAVTVTTTDAPDGVREVETRFTAGRTPRTGETKSAASFSGTNEPDLLDKVEPLQRTGRTPFLNSRVYGEKEWDGNEEETYTHKGFGEGVRGVRQEESGGGAVQPAEDWKRRHPNAPIDGHGRPLPYLGRNGRLVIPFDSDARFHWWNGGQELEETIQAVKHGFRDAEGKEDNAIDV